MVLSKDLKKAIAFGLIVGALISFCSLCFASESVDVDVVNGLSISLQAGVIGSVSSGSVGYFAIEPRLFVYF